MRSRKLQIVSREVLFDEALCICIPYISFWLNIGTMASLRRNLESKILCGAVARCGDAAVRTNKIRAAELGNYRGTTQLNSRFTKQHSSAANKAAARRVARERREAQAGTQQARSRRRRMERTAHPAPQGVAGGKLFLEQFGSSVMNVL